MGSDSRARPDGYDLTKKVEALSAECLTLSDHLLVVIEERNGIELEMIDVERRLVSAKGREKMIRTSLSRANRDLISTQSLLRAIPR